MEDAVEKAMTELEKPGQISLELLRQLKIEYMNWFDNSLDGTTASEIDSITEVDVLKVLTLTDEVMGFVQDASGTVFSTDRYKDLNPAVSGFVVWLAMRGLLMTG